jgi:hypothetical protein
MYTNVHSQGSDNRPLTYAEINLGYFQMMGKYDTVLVDKRISKLAYRKVVSDC